MWTDKYPTFPETFPEIRFQKSVGWLTEMNTRQLRVPFGTAPGLEDLWTRMQNGLQ